ncbi:MAG: KamA family radical SAM protein [Promethearchaeota archaeon]
MLNNTWLDLVLEVQNIGSFNGLRGDYEKVTQKPQKQEQRKLLLLHDYQKYKAYTLHKLDQIEQLKDFPEQMVEEMRIVAHVLPFKTNNYVVNELIDWGKVPNDPIFCLNFPQKGMLLPQHFQRMKVELESGSKKTIKQVADSIRLELNPHPAGQKSYNVPYLHGEKLLGMQHKYRETVLFLPLGGQTCHAYCTFCFRWAQFVGIKDQKLAMKEIDKLIAYIQENPEITDILFTGGDPMVMNPDLLDGYIRPIIDANLPNLKTIRIGSKSIAYWPYKYISGSEADQVLGLFADVVDSGLNLCYMAHFNHYQELQTVALKQATKNILKTGTQIRTQSPLLNHINASPEIWARMWQEQVDLGMVPYYFFVARDTGAQHYFSVPLVEAWEIYRKAYNRVSGIARTVRGPSMSCTPGKVEVLGPLVVNGKKVLTCRFIQGRNPDWVDRVFLAEYDPKAVWFDDLKPAFGDKFWFSDEYDEYLAPFSSFKHTITD